MEECWHVDRKHRIENNRLFAKLVPFLIQNKTYKTKFIKQKLFITNFSLAGPKHRAEEDAGANENIISK